MAALRPAEIAGLLDERFRLLTRGRADAASRQQTLQATVEWSYALLGEAERRVFDCLGVFPASFDAAAATDIAGTDGLQRWDVLDGLTSLVGKSLVAEEEGPDQTSRYRLLETMRAYARQQLADGELDRLRRRHAEYYAAFAERAGLELAGPAQLEWQPRIRAERDNLQAAVTWSLASGGQARPLAFRIVAALAGFAVTSPSTVRGWAEACLAQIGACPPELRGMVLAAAAWSAFFAGDLPLAQRRAEDALRDPAAGDPLSLALLRCVLAQTYMLTGQPECGVSIAREGRQEAAEQGIEIFVGYLLAMEAMAWTAAGDYAAARPPAMEAVEMARRVQNPALSALAFCTAAGAIWPGDPQAALMLIEDSLALTRAGACDPFLGIALMWAGVIRARNGDLPGALAALQEAMAQQHADGDRLLLGMTLRLAAVVLARLGEAGPAAVLSGAFSAHYPPSSPLRKDERMEIDEAQSLARHTLGEAAYSAALARGAAMDDDEVVEYARASSVGSPPCARNPARRHRNHRRARRGRAAGNDRVTQARRRVAAERDPSCSSSRMALPHVVRACPNSRLSVVSDGTGCPGAISPARICLRSRAAIRMYGRGSASPRSTGRLMAHLRLPMNHASPWSSALVNNCQTLSADSSAARGTHAPKCLGCR